MNVLAIYMVEEFYIYAVVQFFFFFSAGKSVLYESRYQSHWSELETNQIQCSTPCNMMFRQMFKVLKSQC